METLESSRVCRLCGQQSGIFINIFDKNENHVKKISAILPILVHEMDFLPKQMCHRCSVKLEEFHKFYSDCLKTDMNLKSQLSWMRKKEVKEHIRVPMVQIENVKMKTEPPDYDIYELDPIIENVNYINSMSSMTFSVNSVRNNKEVNSRRINNVDERLTCNNKRFPDFSHCEFNFDKNNSKNEAALPINCTNIESQNDLRRDSSTTTNLGNSFRLNKSFKNVHGNNEYHHKAKKRYSKEIDGLNIGNILNTNEVKEIKIKTEQPDDMEIRSLRPRKKSVDYIGTKRKKSDLIINPASISKIRNSKRKSTAKKQAQNLLVNSIVIDKIKKEPDVEVQSRILRPRKCSVNYLGSKRKESASAKTDSQNRSKSEEVLVRTKKRKASLDSGQRLAGHISNPNEIKVKKEIVSDDETLDDDENVTFDRETELVIKLEKNVGDEFQDCNWAANPINSRINRGSKSLSNITRKLKPRKVSSKRISEINCPPKYLRSQDLRLRNGKVKKSQSDQELSLGRLKKRFLEFGSRTNRAIDKKSPSRIKENLNVIRVPTPLKTPSSIKHFCEKCCNSFMNKELYMLHTCYYD